MFLTIRIAALTGIAAVVSAVTTVADTPHDPARIEYFEKEVRPILVGRCYACHSAETKPAGMLRVDDRRGLLVGGNSGPAVVPGKPAESLLLKRIAVDAKKRMPADGEHLNPEQIAILTRWITDGAVWPEPAVPAFVGENPARYEELRQKHWAWQPRTQPNVPNVHDTRWPRNDLDRFVLAKLEKKGLNPVRDADRVALIRRVTFDLTGLPPAPDAITGFVNDPSPQAFEKVVDRLIASPAFGERWGRHWLDVARYGESTGPSRNIPYPHAWRYRDYVIDAMNADVPFDRFLREQIAGDLLPADTTAERDRLLTATGFLALGVKDVNQRFTPRYEMDIVDEQIDVVTRSILGLTVSCARCHNHKFDPVSQIDYYALAGIFTSTETAAGLRNQMGGSGLAYYVPERLLRLSEATPPLPAAEIATFKAKVDAAKTAFAKVRGTPEGRIKGPDGRPRQRTLRLKYDQLQAEFQALTDPAAQGLAVHGVREARTIGDTPLRIRGETEKQGAVVPRGFPSAFTVPGTKPVEPSQSGRLQLAEWLTHPNNALTSRVAVNRIWHHLFGRGIVPTVDNFGINGDHPSHPELLDHLANQFIADGWSVKKLVRLIVLSRSYQLSSETIQTHWHQDPDNVLIWHHATRRLDAEQFRDAVLAASGALDSVRPQGAYTRKLKMIELRDNGPEARSIREAADTSRHRSVYLPLLRGVTPRAIEVFDPVDQTLVTGSRDITTVPAQALFLLNSGFIRSQALTTAQVVLVDATASDAERIRTLYLRILGRAPTVIETTRSRTFLAEYAAAYREIRDVPQTASLPRTETVTQPAVPIVDPDQIDQTGVAESEVAIRISDPRTAAWSALSQSLFGTAEFRYLP